MAQPRISVIINNYNYGSFVARALDSALAQDLPDAEIIAVDDGSTDHSRAVLERYRERIRLVYQENRGQAAAINAGVQASRGDVICFLDADDWWAPGKLAAVAAAFAADPTLSLVYHRLQPVLIDGSFTLKPIPRTLCSGDLTRRLAISAGWWPFPMTSAISVRRTAWDAAGDIPESFRISADAWLVGIHPFLGRVAALPAALGFYLIHGGNNWFRNTDAALLRKRMAHWRATVEVTNRFLAARGSRLSVRLDDHFPYHVAAARLNGVDPAGRLRLAIHGLRFAGEPNPLRRLVEVVRTVQGLPAAGRTDPLLGDPE